MRHLNLGFFGVYMDFLPATLYIAFLLRIRAEHGMSLDQLIKNTPVYILCGGLGTRIKEETAFRPKPMVPIGTHPILWHIMRWYSRFGFKNFVLCLFGLV